MGEEKETAETSFFSNTWLEKKSGLVNKSDTQKEKKLLLIRRIRSQSVGRVKKYIGMHVRVVSFL